MAKRIYILEDDQGIREIMQLILNDEGFEVKGFACVQDFNAHAFDPFPDLYVLDIMLPDGNGIEVCKALKLRVETAAIPVMMMSAHVEVDAMRRNCGAESHIAKPFDIFQLIDKIRLLTEVSNG